MSRKGKYFRLQETQVRLPRMEEGPKCLLPFGLSLYHQGQQALQPAVAMCRTAVCEPEEVIFERSRPGYILEVVQIQLSQEWGRKMTPPTQGPQGLVCGDLRTAVTPPVWSVQRQYSRSMLAISSSSE
jgi:hypothetical protein